MVYLIGAGPGDPNLITVRGLDCVRAADVVVYDHLIPRRLLAYARHGAELIDIGVASPQPMAQEAISYLLADKAREGLSIARSPAATAARAEMPPTATPPGPVSSATVPTTTNATSTPPRAARMPRRRSTRTSRAIHSRVPMPRGTT